MRFWAATLTPLILTPPYNEVKGQNMFIQQRASFSLLGEDGWR